MFCLCFHCSLTKYHKFSALKQHPLVFYRSYGSEVQARLRCVSTSGLTSLQSVSTGLCPHLEAWLEKCKLTDSLRLIQNGIPWHCCRTGSFRFLLAIGQMMSPFSLKGDSQVLDLWPYSWPVTTCIFLQVSRSPRASLLTRQSHIKFNVIAGLTSFCHILLVRSKSQVPCTVKERDLQHWRTCVEQRSWEP